MKLFSLQSSMPISPIKVATEEGYRIQVQADDVDDGYHTMYELYKHRMALFVALCNQFGKNELFWDTDALSEFGVSKAWKSKLHSDGTVPFNDERYFIAGLTTPYGQITYHMQINKWWDRFRVPELERAPEYDGHTSDDVIERLLKL